DRSASRRTVMSVVKIGEAPAGATTCWCVLGSSRCVACSSRRSTKARLETQGSPKPHRSNGVCRLEGDSRLSSSSTRKKARKRYVGTIARRADERFIELSSQSEKISELGLLGRKPAIAGA